MIGSGSGPRSVVERDQQFDPPVASEPREILSGQVRPPVVPPRDPGNARKAAMLIGLTKAHRCGRERARNSPMPSLSPAVPEVVPCGATKTASLRNESVNCCARSPALPVFQARAYAAITSAIVMPPSLPQGRDPAGAGQTRQSPHAACPRRAAILDVPGVLWQGLVVVRNGGTCLRSLSQRMDSIPKPAVLPTRWCTGSRGDTDQR